MIAPTLRTCVQHLDVYECERMHVYEEESSHTVNALHVPYFTGLCWVLFCINFYVFSVVDFRWILLAFRVASGSDFGGQVGAKIDLKSHFFGLILEGRLRSRFLKYFC